MFHCPWKNPTFCHFSGYSLALQSFLSFSFASKFFLIKKNDRVINSACYFSHVILQKIPIIYFPFFWLSVSSNVRMPPTSHSCSPTTKFITTPLKKSYFLKRDIDGSLEPRCRDNYVLHFHSHLKINASNYSVISV